MRGKRQQQHVAKAGYEPRAAAVSFSTIASGGPQAYPILEAFSRIGVKPVKGYELIEHGELQTFLIGRRRYATADAITAFLDHCIAKSKETAAQRAKKVAAATKASLRSRRLERMAA
jgi:hypothetical protein